MMLGDVFFFFPWLGFWFSVVLGVGLEQGYIGGALEGLITFD
jgi:hypothetical protein